MSDHTPMCLIGLCTLRQGHDGPHSYNRPRFTPGHGVNIMDRLRTYAGGTYPITQEAADEIERLRASERTAWNAAVDRDTEIDRLRGQLAKAEQWRDYYRARWLGDRAVPQPEPPESTTVQPAEDTALLDWADANGYHDCLYESLRAELRDQGREIPPAVQPPEGNQ